MVRQYMRLTGRVQGVGFRWFTQQSAQRLGLTGWVRNREDDDVELEVQGDEAAVDAFTGAVCRGPAHARVDGVEAKRRPTDPDERLFCILDERYW